MFVPSYPEGNFGGNQLLDGSISLSPLYPNLTIDLHVRIATSLHQSFLASPYSGIVHHLFGSQHICSYSNLSSRIMVDGCQPLERLLLSWPNPFTFIAPRVSTQILAYVRLLGPCFQDGSLNHFPNAVNHQPWP